MHYTGILNGNTGSSWHAYRQNEALLLYASTYDEEVRLKTVTICENKK